MEKFSEKWRKSITFNPRWHYKAEDFSEVIKNKI